MGTFFGSLIFVLSLISLTLALATVSRGKAAADTSTKLHIFLVQAVVVLSVILLLLSGYFTLKCLMKGPRVAPRDHPAQVVRRR
jgi:hypothetical protein